MDTTEHIVYFPTNDLAFPLYYHEACELLSSGFVDAASSVTDAIELYQSFLLIQDRGRLDGEDEAFCRLMASANKAKGRAFRLIRNTVTNDGFRKVLEEAEEVPYYGNRVWSLIDACKAYEDVGPSEFSDAISGSPLRIRNACGVAWPNKAFPNQLRDALVADARLATVLLIERYSSAPVHDRYDVPTELV